MAVITKRLFALYSHRVAVPPTRVRAFVLLLFTSSFFFTKLSGQVFRLFWSSEERVREWPQLVSTTEQDFDSRYDFFAYLSWNPWRVPRRKKKIRSLMFSYRELFLYSYKSGCKWDRSWTTHLKYCCCRDWRRTWNRRRFHCGGGRASPSNLYRSF